MNFNHAISGRRIKELKKVSSPSASPIALFGQQLPTDQFTAGQSSSGFPKAASSPHPQAHNIPPADPSRPLLHTPTSCFPPPLSYDVEMMLRQWYTQSMPPAQAGLGTTPLSAMNGDTLPMTQISQMHLGPDLQKIVNHAPHGMPHLADRSGEEMRGGQLGITRQYDPSRRPELDRSHDSDDSSCDSDDSSRDMEGTRGNSLNSPSVSPPFTLPDVGLNTQTR
jgi:hypothetical protein